MVAGDDILLHTQGLGRLRALEICAHVIHHRWRNALFQSGRSGKIHDGHGAVRWGGEHEVFVYRDRSAFALWEQFEAHPDNVNTLIHLLAYEEEQITVVVDDASASDMATLLAAMRRSIRSMSMHFMLKSGESA